MILVLSLSYFFSTHPTNHHKVTSPTKLTRTQPEHITYALATAHTSTLILCARNPDNLHRVASHITNTICASHPRKPTIHIQPCDISSPTSIAALATYVTENILSQENGRLDTVIPNASYAPPITGMKITENPPEEIRRAFDTNFLGVYSIAHHFVPMLLSSRAKVGGLAQFLVIGSIAGCITKGIIANTGYTISKMAQIRLVEYLDVQYGEEGLLAVAVHPGSVMTGMAEGNTPEAFLRYLVDDVGLCGAVVVWLVGQQGEKNGEDVRWLGGRLISANWDVRELMERKGEIVERDLLKFELLYK